MEDADVQLEDLSDEAVEFLRPRVVDVPEGPIREER